MRIVHLTDTYAPAIGGIERQVERLATLQAAAGHDVTVVSGRHGGPPVTRAAGVLVRRPQARVHPGHALPLHVDDMDADVFHAHLSVASPGGLRAAALVHAVGLPLAVTVHSMWPTAQVVPSVLVRLAGLDDPGVAWSAVSGVAAARVETALSGDCRVDVVPNVVDTAWWHNPSPVQVGDRMHAVIVGRLSRRKRVLPVLQSLARDWPARLDVTIVGDGAQLGRVRALVRRHDLTDVVRLVGARTPAEVRRLLHDGTDLFLAPSALESFGIAALEARAAGVPVVARRETGIADFVRDGVDGWFADSDDDLAAGVAALAGAPAQLLSLATHARATPPPVSQTVGLDAVERLYTRAASVVVAQPARSAKRFRGGNSTVGGAGLRRGAGGRPSPRRHDCEKWCEVLGLFPQ